MEEKVKELTNEELIQIYDKLIEFEKRLSDELHKEKGTKNE